MHGSWLGARAKKSEEKDKKKQVFFGRESYRAFLFW
jgi:hypothetical protein